MTKVSKNHDPTPGTKGILADALLSGQIALSNAKKIIDSSICVWFDCQFRKLAGNHNVYMSDNIGENHSLENFIKENDDNIGCFWLSVDFKDKSHAKFQIIDDVADNFDIVGELW